MEVPGHEWVKDMSDRGVWSDPEVVETKFGKVSGFAARENTRVWKAVPFAAPPVGDLRWRAPRDPQPWSGVRAKRRFCSPCSQMSPVFRTHVFGSEDCLYLNIWRSREATERLPVYVWIHGGGNSIGSATIVHDYYGDPLASRAKVVFVSINYRLGPFGWFSHPSLRSGASPADASGNYGTLDIIKALEWVRDNIDAFGGDASNVTVGGESAGAMNILSLLLSPLAAGLFHKAVIESGAPVTRDISEADEKSESVLLTLLGREMAVTSVEEKKSLRERMDNQTVASYLRACDAKELVRTYRDNSVGLMSNPTILNDGYVLPANGYEGLESGDYPNKVPVIIGCNRDETKLFLYFAHVPWREPLYAAVAKYGSARWKAAGVDGVARRLARAPGQPPVFAYDFAWGAPDRTGRSVLPGHWGQRLGAFHSSEIPFFLGTDTLNGYMHYFLYNRRNAESRRVLSHAIMGYVTSFVHSGDPNAMQSGNVPRWDPWSNDPGGARFIVLNSGAIRMGKYPPVSTSDGRPPHRPARGMQKADVGELLDITMSRFDLTVEGVMKELDSSLDEPLRSEVKARILFRGGI